MKIVFLLGNPDIGGGTYVIYQHALKCLDENNEVTIVTDEVVTPKRIAWHKGAERLTFKKYKDVENEEFDVAIATWWRTIYELPKIKAKSYIYFVQSIESKFYEEQELKWLVEATYTLPLSIITEATWIKKYLETNYALDVKLVRNGIRKDIYLKQGEVYPKPKENFRVLIEGPVDVPFKNVPSTVNLVKKSKADEIWLLTSSDIKEYPGVDKVFSRMPISECAKIYRSCDVIVKLSYVEGMFGPPLEMFHCGGTAITYDVTGHDEYLKSEYNSLIVATDDEDGVIKSINRLYDNRQLLEKLKANAQKTADKWPDWDDSSSEFYEAVKKYSKIKINSKWLNANIIFHGKTYQRYQEMNISTKTKIGNFLRNKLPFLYKIYRLLRYGKVR
ncbi:MAG: glycosyltransferase family 4 protein [Firmicutes bacterium]|nr:glycosyltransferase family 4 protein [Bacillota bacterium]